MITSLADQLRRDEGFSSKPYPDSVGKSTIGYGRNLDDVGISQAAADFMLAEDIKAATVKLESTFPWTTALDESRKGVLINMTFNMGIGGLATFKAMLAAVQSGDYAAASQAMLQSKWADQVGSRAQRLSIQMQTGNWQ